MKVHVAILLLCIINVVRCDRTQEIDENRIQKRSYYHPGAYNELTYHTPAAVPFAANPFLFKAHHDPGFIKPFGIGASHVLPAPLPPPAPVIPAAKFFPGDAWVTQHSVTYPKYPVLPPPVVPTAPLAPPLFPAPALKPFVGFVPQPVSYVPVPKPVVFPIPRPVIAQPAFTPAAVHPVIVKPIVPVLPAHHHHHPVAVQPTVSSENPENPSINNNPDQQHPIHMPEIDETESPSNTDQSTHTHNIPGLPPTFVMQIGTSGSGFGTGGTISPSASPPQSPFNTATFASPSRPPSTFSFGGMVPQMIPIYMQMMHHHPHNPEPEDGHFNHIQPSQSYGAPSSNYGPPIRNQRLRDHPRSQKLRRKPYRHHRIPHRHPKKLRYTIIKHHHDRK